MHRTTCGLAVLIVASALLATPAQAAEADFVKAKNPVAGGSFIVSLKPGAAVQASSSALTQRYGGTLDAVFSHAMRGFQVKNLTEAAARRLAADPAVKAVYQDGTAKALDVQTNPTWGLDRVDQANLPLDKKFTYPSGGASNVTVYVTDTGIKTSIADFEGRASVGADFIEDGQNGQDCSGHGTHVAGTVGSRTYGVAKKAKLVSVRMLGASCGNSGPDSAGVKAIEWVTANAQKPAVVNASWTFDTADIGNDAIAGMISSGVQMAAASGNSSTNACSTGPAKIASLITVNATSTNDARASFSNFGSCTDIFAPGDGITSLGLNGGATNMSGTSMASPHVAGVAALYLSANPSASPQALRDALVNNATDGKVTNPGTGSPNKLLYSGFIGGGPDQVCGPGTNGDDVSIPDTGTAVSSSVTISGCTGNSTASATVKVDINHTYTGDLAIDLVSPSGKSYVLKKAGGASSSAGVHETYTVDLSSEARNGTWKLQVTDIYTYDVGNIDTWTLTV
ncbi:Proprotein convertase P-domain-containing protein [Lentzea albidocapillata subsp. violacea]|uniref:Proprotein convertase P-domain-containing protein n=1 Tax=Lentzea albidocapillata subsp. violacea TaxID=128104 RepID=A0A1G8QMT4_9PSEU|nr:S8 family serine peptidase [Lentzea albidocapillata]SDJ06109.1 Proprotein convertase P-domain-containing protein [Lentzea albidocapillata subsp. violacea]